MDCLAMLDSGNYALFILKALERKGIFIEATGVPCKISKGNCNLCLKFDESLSDEIIGVCKIHNMPVREMYRIFPELLKNRYVRII